MNQRKQIHVALGLAVLATPAYGHSIISQHFPLEDYENATPADTSSSNDVVRDTEAKLTGLTTEFAKLDYTCWPGCIGDCPECQYSNHLATSASDSEPATTHDCRILNCDCYDLEEDLEDDRTEIAELTEQGDDSSTDVLPEVRKL